MRLKAKKTKGYLPGEPMEYLGIIIHGEMCRIEVRPADLGRMVSEPVRSQVIACCQEAGFKYVTIDLQGYRTGSLNEVLDS